MSRQLQKAEEIEVKTNVAGVPVSLTRKGRSQKVAGIYERWRLADEWWGEEVNRDYFRVRTSARLVCDIYHDVKTDHWYLDKIHD